jgi:hypothetical protein
MGYLLLEQLVLKHRPACIFVGHQVQVHVAAFFTAGFDTIKLPVP